MPGVAGGETGGRSWSNRQSTSWRTFDNALCRLQPRRKTVRPCLVPAFGHRGEPPLIAVALEAKPTLAVLSGDRDRASKRIFAPLGCSSAIREPLNLLPAGGGDAPVDSTSLCGSGSDQPHFPSLSLRVEKRPITHRRVLPASLVRARFGLTDFYFARRVPKLARITLKNHEFFRCKRTYSCARIIAHQVFSLCRDDRSSEGR